MQYNESIPDIYEVHQAPGGVFPWTDTDHEMDYTLKLCTVSKKTKLLTAGECFGAESLSSMQKTQPVLLANNGILSTSSEQHYPELMLYISTIFREEGQ